MEFNSKECRLCPRNCGADRTKKSGFCKEGILASVARADIHMWEEPCISGKNGSGTVFFSGCPLKCVFCQNHEISHDGMGEEISDETLARIFLYLKEKGAHNINLVNPTHFVPNILSALDLVKKKLGIPVVYNCGGYEKVETMRLLDGYIDIFLPDIKYVSPELSKKYSGAENYFSNCIKAIREMFSLVGYPEFDNDGLMTRGVLVRHLVLPSHVSESLRVLEALSENFDTKKLYISLMSQYFPCYKAQLFPEISRKLTTLEYRKVTDHAIKLGITNGFCQRRSSATEQYVPAFSKKLDLELPDL